MKKFAALLLIILSVFALFSCGNSSDEESSSDEASEITTEEDVTAEETTRKNASAEEMSPSEIDVTIPVDVIINTEDIPFSSYEEIDAKDSELPDSMCEKVLKSSDAEYFFMDSEKKILVIFFDENEVPSYSACYDMESGALEFIGDDVKTWYYNEDGTCKCIVYTFSFGASTPPIYTFYNAEGKKEVTRTMDGWYSPDYEKLTEEQVYECIKKYKGTIEATKEYISIT